MTATLALTAALSALHGAEHRSGVVRLSNGQDHAGEIWFTNGQLRVCESDGGKTGRYVNVAQDELAGVSFAVKERSMERPWRFKEAGSDEKEYLPGTYPLVNLQAEVTLASGKALTGHLMNAPVYVRVPDPANPMDHQTLKFHMKYQQQGEAGQKYEDLVFVEEIRFTDGKAAAAPGAAGSVHGRVSGLGKLEQVAAYGINRGRAYPGKVLDAEKGTFVVPDLPKDRYDLAVLTERGIRVGLSEAGAEVSEAPRALEDGDAKTLAALVADFRDFFDAQEVVAVKGHREAAKVLVLQRRTKPMHDQQGLGDRELRRLDIWRFHLRKTEWQADAQGRGNLFRYFELRGQPGRAVTVEPALGGIALDPAARKDVEVVYPAPAAEKKKESDP